VGQFQLDPPLVEHFWSERHLQSPSLSGFGEEAKDGHVKGLGVVYVPAMTLSIHSDT
jgi:hypothetical protein